MKETLRSEVNDEPKLCGLQRPLAGAFIGFVLFLLILLLSKIIGFNIFSIALLAPGLWTSTLLGSSITNETISNLFAFVISCILPAALGSQIISTNKTVREKGISFLIIYIIFSLLTALLMFRIALD